MSEKEIKEYLETLCISKIDKRDFQVALKKREQKNPNTIICYFEIEVNASKSVDVLVDFLTKEFRTTLDKKFIESEVKVNKDKKIIVDTLLVSVERKINCQN